MLNYDQGASLLGLAPITLRRWVMKREIPFYKLGSRVLFDEAELFEWLKTKRRGPGVPGLPQEVKS